MTETTLCPSDALKPYYLASKEIATLSQSATYPRKTIHDINNSLGKINNALWLMEREQSADSPFFKQCQQIIEQELTLARDMLTCPANN